MNSFVIVMRMCVFIHFVVIDLLLSIRDEISSYKQCDILITLLFYSPVSQVHTLEGKKVYNSKENDYQHLCLHFLMVNHENSLNVYSWDLIFVSWTQLTYFVKWNYNIKI